VSGLEVDRVLRVQAIGDELLAWWVVVDVA
jgi:hypothetical protein